MTEKFNVNDLTSPKGIVIIVLLAITVISFVFEGSIYGENSVFNSNLTGNSAVDWVWQHMPHVISTLRILFLAWVVNTVLQIILDVVKSESKKVLTAIKLLKSIVKYIVYILALLLVLTVWGVDTTTLIASAGILGLVIGLGAQSLIADILAGVFMVFESEFEVGDIIVIDGWRGTVQEIGLRTTKIVDTGGNVKIINNSSIHTVVNQTKQLSLAKAYIGIEYGESLERVEIVIRDNLSKIKAHIPGIVNGPYYKGVDELGDSSVNLLFTADVKEEDIYVVQRALNRELKLMFDANGINIPFPQVVLNEPCTFDSAPASEYTVRQAKKFADEQSEISKDREDVN